jgi:hypothetical protein
MTTKDWWKDQEPKPRLEVTKGNGLMGRWWKVTYSWEFGGRKFSYGSGEMLEDLLPEEKNLEDIKGLVYEIVDHVIRGHTATVSMYNKADDVWVVVVIKRNDQGLYEESLREFGSFDEAVAYIKDVKYAKLLGKIK